MKKGFYKLLGLMLSVMMVLSLAGCKKGDAPDGDKPAQGAEDGNTPTGSEENNNGDDGDEEYNPFERPFDKYIKDEVVVDLNGYEFKVVDFHAHRWDPETISSPQDELVVAMVEDVENTFNCTITYENIGPGEIFDIASPEIMGGGKFVDLLGTTMWAFGKFLGSNLVADLTEVETLNLDSPWWNKSVIETTSFGPSTYAFGGLFGTHFSNYWVTYYNKRIWNELGLPDPYELVESGEWTFDKFVDYAKRALSDMDGDGLVTSEADRWGVSAPEGDMEGSLYFGLGGKYYQIIDELTVRLACIDSDSADKLDALYNFYQKDNVLYKNENLGYLEMFASGKALFCCYMNNGGLPQLKDMEDDFGVLPMPKWNKEQPEYICAPDHNAPIFAMTSTNRNTYEAGIIIEALGRRYQAYDDITMEDYTNTFWRDDRDAELVAKYVINHGAYDIINMIKNANSNFNLPATVVDSSVRLNQYSDMVSTIKAVEGALNVMLDEFFANLAK